MLRASEYPVKCFKHPCLSSSGGVGAHFFFRELCVQCGDASRGVVHHLAHSLNDIARKLFSFAFFSRERRARSTDLFDHPTDVRKFFTVRARGRGCSGWFEVIDAVLPLFE